MKLKAIKISLSIFLAIIGFYLLFLNFTEPTEIGIARNCIYGNMWLQKESGWHISPPWVIVANISTAPMRVGISSSGHGYSSKLVQFDSNGWIDFVHTEGFRYYWWSNRFSINFGHDEEYRGMRDIMLGYAYSPDHHNFIKILDEYQEPISLP